MKYALLASGSKGNSFIVEDGETIIMIDCGSTKKHLFSCLERLKLKKEDIDAVVLTHDHSDHISQLKHFKESSIYAPIPLDDEYEAFLVRPMQKFMIGSIELTPLPLSHDALNTTGYILSNGSEKIVYITDTGYVNEKYFPLLEGADDIILESNHDVEMLMATSRPQYLKMRIYGDSGHLNNTDCAEVLRHIATENTKHIILAHLSEQANTRELALETTMSALKDCNLNCTVSAAGQYEMIQKGEDDEKSDFGTVSSTLGMESSVKLLHIF